MRVALLVTALAGFPHLAVAVSDVPKEFAATPARQDFDRRVAMIPMRDGVKLHTIVFVPKGARDAPMLLTRTPYNASLADQRIAADRFLRDGYIRVVQDVRGKYGSEGDYVVAWPARGPLNSGDVDHATDAWDTIAWLVGNVQESNGRVGMIGSSYTGFTTAMALLDPHPALKAAVPQGPLIDAWMGDDWFHHGAFRNLMLGYIHMQTGQRGEGAITPTNTDDKYQEFLEAGSTGDYVRAWNLDKLPWIARTIAHPAYDAYWQAQALDRLLAERPSSVPTLWTQGLWDQEDMWGANHAWRSLASAGHGDNNWLVLGPWNHIQVNTTGFSLGPLQWHENTSHDYHRDMLMPFLDEYLRGGPPAGLARVTVFNTGRKQWEEFSSWPASCERGCRASLSPLYLGPAFSLSFDRPQDEDAGDSYVSDPAKPVPFLPRPVIDPFANLGSGVLGSPYEPWSKWLVQDQRFVDGRTDVLTYRTDVLTEPVHVSGVPIADLRAMTTGSDGDFVVKLIDVYPDSDPANPGLGGYQLPIAMDIFRGRYRESFEHPSAIPANEPQKFRFELPNVNHVFMPGHRIMVQVQSTLFPLYDRNPQTFVPNIFDARSADYVKAEVTVLRTAAQPSAVWLPIVEPAG